MEVTLGTLVDSIEVLKKLNGAEMTMGVSYKVHKILDLVNKELALFEKLHKELVLKYGVQSEKDPNRYEFRGDSKDKFNGQVNELLSQVVTIDREPLSISEVDKIGGWTPELTGVISWMIKE